MATLVDPSSPRSDGSLDTKNVSLAMTSHVVELYAADEETLLRLFRTKMKHALAETGYDQDAQTKVSSLIERNIISCGVTLNGQLEQSHQVFNNPDMVQAQLEQLVSGDLHINTNEPVLLILCDNSSSISDDTSSRDLCCAMLRDVFHIFPVRVYVAKHLPDQSQISSHNNGLSIAVLNVVNTDIGGPGMIELLDSDVASPEWRRMMISAEAWHHRDLLWRHQTEIPVGKVVDDTRLDVDNELGMDKTNVLSKHSESYTPDQEPEGQELESQELYAGSVTIPQEAEMESQDTFVSEDRTIEHPAMPELRAWEDSRPRIQHPSWNHSHAGDSLIDMIRMQASGLNEHEADQDDRSSIAQS